MIGGIGAGLQIKPQKDFNDMASKVVPAVIKSGDPKAIEQLMNDINLHLAMPGWGYSQMDWSPYSKYLPQQAVMGPF